MHKLINFLLIAAVTLILVQVRDVQAQDIHVGLEPFPPAINPDGTGYAIDMFKSIEQKTDLTFHFHLMNYARAKKELKNKKIDMIGITPQSYETPGFYNYAQDLYWSLNVSVDLFSFKKKYFNINHLPPSSIGTLRGNADFFSELLHIPRNKFIEVSELDHLANMLKLGRLHVIVFERVALISTFKALNITDVYYQQFGVIPASFAVQNNKKGKQLQNKIDLLLLNISNKEFFPLYYKYKGHQGQSNKLISNNDKKILTKGIIHKLG